jgi:hypothetical protein
MSKAKIISGYLRRQAPMLPFTLALTLAITIGLIDYLTGDEITIDPFYSIPICSSCGLGIETWQ